MGRVRRRHAGSRPRHDRGTDPDTGIGGLTTGGGIGWLGGKFGLASDNLIAAEVVTADGRVVQANDEQNPDLFWALRGGGGNFGVITSFKYRLHTVGTLLAGLLAHPVSEAKKVLSFYKEWEPAYRTSCAAGRRS